MLKKLTVLTLAMLSVSTNATEVKAHATPHWSYTGPTGPTHWGNLSPEYTACKTGQKQSPINITKSVKANLPALQFNYHPVPLAIENNGHSIKVEAPAGTLRMGEVSYQLQQFHFHTPAEEAIQGKRADLVVHLVHREGEHLAVVAIFLNQGKSNPLIEAIWKVLPKTVGALVKHEAISVDLNQWLPVDKNYYTYEGSLTTPACTEGVKWLVLKQPMTISAEQLAKFRELYPNNARPLQALNGREVLSSN